MFSRTALAAIAGLMLAACTSPSLQQENASEAATTELTEEAVLAAQRAGYALVTRNGEQVLCRQDAQTGTRLQRSTICLTTREWARVRNSSRQTLQDAARGHKPACPQEGNC